MDIDEDIEEEKIEHNKENSTDKLIFGRPRREELKRVIDPSSLEKEFQQAKDKRAYTKRNNETESLSSQTG